MSVIFVNRYFYPDASATSQILTDLAFGLAADGVPVRVVTSRQNYHDISRAFAPRETKNGVDIRRVWSTRFGRRGLWGRFLDSVSFMASLGLRILFSANKSDTVVVMTDPPMVGWVVFIAASLKGAKTVHWTQDVFPETSLLVRSRWIRGPVMAVLKVLRDMLVRGCKTDVIIGERMSEYLISRGLSSSKFCVIYNWVDGWHIRPVAKDQNRLRKEWGLDGKFVIGYSGNMGRVHEFDAILDAAALLTPDDKFRFLFTADGFYRDRVIAQAAERGLSNILFKPPHPYDELSQCLGVSDAHLVSLRPALEGFIVPSKFYGIAAAGVPTLFIGDPDGEIARLIQRHECGVVVASGDSSSLAASIRQLERDRALCSKMGSNARKMFEEHFDKHRAFRQWKEVIG
jgi:glycosyltransferase involved in cell wall biosynthesis